MARKGTFCVVGFGILAAACGWYWLWPSHANDASKTARARQDERQFIMGMVIYWKSFKTYPAGDNPAIVRALGGDNSSRTPIFHPRSDSTNKAGALLDPWGTAYEIGVNPTNGPAVRSAGENKKFGDQDDVITDLKSLGLTRQ